MKNIVKIISFLIFTILLTVGSSFAQEEVKPNKSEKKCSAGCCSAKEAGTEMKMEGMDHGKMSNHMSIDKNKDGKIFECPMKCEAGKDEAGECSKCGMNLKEVSVKDSDHKHGNKEHKMMDHSKMDHSLMYKKENTESEEVDFASIDKNKNGKVFQCPMVCDDKLTDEAADCSVCGMHMKEILIKDIKIN